MSMNISEALLQRPEQGSFDITAQPTKLCWEFQIHFDAATLGKAINVPASRRAKTCFIQQWWMQEIGDGTGFSDTFVHDLTAISNNLLSISVQEQVEIHF